MSLSQLPNELLEYILSFLPPLEIAKCRQVSHLFCGIIEASVALRIHIELAIDGLVLRPQSEMNFLPQNLSVLLDKAKRLRYARDTLQPESMWTLQYPGDDGRYEASSSLPRRRFTDGVFVWSDYGSNSEWPTTIRCEELAPKSAQSMAPSSLETSITIRDLTFSAPDNLLVLLEVKENMYRVYFKTLSTGEDHPKASSPIVEDKAHVVLPNETASLHLRGKHLVQCGHLWIALDCRMGSVRIWNWQTSEVMRPNACCLDAAFISDDLVLLFVDWENPEDTRPSGIGSLGLAVFSLVNGQITYRIETPFPSLPCGVIFGGPQESQMTPSPAKLGGMFASDESLSIIVIETAGWDTWMDTMYFVLSCRALQQALDATNGSQNKEYDIYGHNIVKWDTWGRDGTRILPQNMFSHSGERSVHGARVALRGPPDRITTDWTTCRGFGYPQEVSSDVLTVLDFNPRPIIRGDPLPDDSDDWVYLSCDKPTTCTIFSVESRLVDVETALPFRAMVSRKAWQAQYTQLYSTAILRQQETTFEIMSFLPVGVDDGGEGFCRA
ncbi:hypothetical protein PIIN_10564 [Serendipita indica DSM 11827]|uniref:F-box domain-containing protein n=2 Tax=Serendipita indica (strain DSM 11827) TaxID=1109443 RepID=G4TZ29_SERID|nr:hypothetical protein PIIN_10564 [Serendipita indica DSM 11827]